MATLPLDDVVDVKISIGPVDRVRTSFNLALIVGTSKVIDKEQRVKVYSSTDAMTAEGWTGEEPEFKAAQLYFSQNPRPSKVAIGVHDDSVGTETAVQAMTACRKANTEWYVGYYCGASKEDIKNLSEYMESASPESVYAYNTYDSEILENTKGNIVEALAEFKRRRTFGQFSSHDHAVMGIIGYAMGANTQTEGSVYTLNAKRVSGLKTEEIESTDLNYLKNNNCNVYVNRGSVYSLFEDGVMSNGIPFDEVIYLDMLKNELQSTGIRAFQRNPKIAQTEPGMTGLLNELTEPLEKYRSMGFIAPGIWKGSTILTLKNGDVLEKGYTLMSGSIDAQSQVEREGRVAPPIYIPIKLAGAIERVAIEVFANR